MVQSLFLATGNPGKITELKQLLQPLGVQIKTQQDQPVEMPEETGQTFIENAILKARAVAQQINGAALADDSGLVVDALVGAPGIYSARYAGAQADAAQNNAKLLQVMQPIAQAQRQAQFYCAIAVCRYVDDPMPLVATGAWQGRILTAPSGERGFGYDPLFYVPQFNMSAAALPANVKQQHSHRAKALQALMPQLQMWLS